MAHGLATSETDKKPPPPDGPVAVGRFIAKLIGLGHESVLEHESISVLMGTSRAMLAEITRHRLASYSVESTRYVKYSAGLHVVGQPGLYDGFGAVEDGWAEARVNDAVGSGKGAPAPGLAKQDASKPRKIKFYDEIWMKGMKDAWKAYQGLLKAGHPAEIARDVLPLCALTHIRMTANVREWRHILRLRTSKAAHPQMRDLMSITHGLFMARYPVLFQDIEPYAPSGEGGMAK
jgi:thymidylate synthase (FAD)